MIMSPGLSNTSLFFPSIISLVSIAIVVFLFRSILIIFTLFVAATFVKPPAIEMALKGLGYDFEMGAGLAEAERVFGEAL